MTKTARKIILLFSFLFSYLFANGAYDGGTSAGKGNFDISLTLNPFNYFNQGQSYTIIGYGITNNIDFHFYYSIGNKLDNYYAGIFYQFINHERIDLSTAFGIRKFTSNTLSNYFLPQLLYTIKLNNKFKIGGSFVNVRNKNMNSNGITIDTFLTKEIYSNKKINIDFSLGIFRPVLWQPNNSEFHGTYSLSIKLKN